MIDEIWLFLLYYTSKFCIHLCNHHLNYDVKHFHHLRKFSYGLCSQSQPQMWLSFIFFSPLVLFVLGLHVNGILQIVIPVSGFLNQHNVFEIYPPI